MTHINSSALPLPNPPMDQIRPLFWAYVSGGLFILHHLLFGLLLISGGATQAIMFVTLSTSGFWALLALVVSLKQAARGIKIWHLRDVPENTPATDATDALFFSRVWGRRLALAGVNMAVVALALMLSDLAAVAGGWLLLSALACLVYALAFGLAIPDPSRSRKSQRDHDLLASSVPRVTRRKKWRL